MIIKVRNGSAFDTARDLTPAERHVLQKLMIWETMASSVDEFKEKTREALAGGWSDSGPIRESKALKAIIEDMEENLVLRLKAASSS